MQPIVINLTFSFPKYQLSHYNLRFMISEECFQKTAASLQQKGLQSTCCEKLLYSVL